MEEYALNIKTGTLMTLEEFKDFYEEKYLKAAKARGRRAGEKAFNFRRKQASSSRGGPLSFNNDEDLEKEGPAIGSSYLGNLKLPEKE